MKVLAFLVSGSLMLSAAQLASASETVLPQSSAETAPGAPAQAAPLSPDELNQLVAPIALYPDALVAQIVAAASYPTEVVEADRWIQQHSDLKGQALAEAVDPQQWDPSVKALTQFSSVLASMDKNLSWTSALGEAYVNEPQNVLDAVQVMRQRAQQAGNLKNTPQETVTNDGQTIAIEPANPDVVYVPEYDPWTAYGAPLAFYPDWVGVPGAFYYGPGIDFGIGIGLFAGFGWGWNHWGADWHRHDVMYDHHSYVSHSPTFDRNRALAAHHDFARGNAFGPGSIDHGDFGHSVTGHADSGHAGFDHGGVDHGGIDHAGVGRPGIGGADVSHLGGMHGGIAGGAPLGIHSGAFSGIDHGGITNAYSSRGQASVHGDGGGGGGGGFHGGGGGGFHGGGGGGSHGGGGGHR
jgi:hypothetical protein